MTTYKPDTNENDIDLANVQKGDADYEISLLRKAQNDTFWEPLAQFGLVTSESRSAMKEWLITAEQNHDMSDFYEEFADPFRHLVIQLLSRASESSNSEGVDLALTVLEQIATKTPENLSIFRDMAQSAYEAAKSRPEIAAQLKLVKESLSQDQARQDALETQIALSGAEFNVYGDVKTTADPLKLRDLSAYGVIYDGNVYLSHLSLLSSPSAHAFQKRKSVRILAHLLSRNVHRNHPAHRHFFRFLIEEIPKSKGIDLVSQLDALRIILVNQDLHFLFIQENGLFALTSILKSETKHTQPIYLTGYNLWLLSYNSFNDVFFEQHSIVDQLVNIIRCVNREKVLRIVLLVFTNIIERRKFKEVMIGSELHKVLPVLMSRKWKDSDIESDLALINDKLVKRLHELSSFEMYTAELDSGSLKKSPVHCERFWRENATKFDNDPDLTYLKKLINQLASDSNESVEVACYDIGEFCRFHPSGKHILHQLRAKERLMQLMDHPNADISKAALLATQKLLIHKWDEIIQSQKASGLK